ncbi:hypothetical protein C1N71_12630 [Agrococcus sp. SGAir0287]|nr:hypothetical protein C1N71_12630 [Agrococcus sp. SGAir0287]
MNAFLVLLIALGVAAVVAVVIDVRTDGYRAHPVDPVLRQRLLDRDEVQRTLDAARDAADAARTPVVPPGLAAWRDAPHVAVRRTRIRARRVIR